MFEFLEAKCKESIVNIFDVEIERFTSALIVMLIATIVFYILGAFTQNSMLVMFEHLSIALALFIAPVAFILSMKEVYNIAMGYKARKMKKANVAARTAKKKSRRKKR